MAAMSIENVQQLEDMLSQPREWLIQELARLDGDIIVLGAGGKMGPSLTMMARRALDEAGSKRRVIAVSRFSSADARAMLEQAGIETVSADLMDRDALAALPDAPNVVYMAGMKFGTTGNQAATWAMNACLPGAVASRYKGSRIAAFSTGNIYGMVPVASSGSKEADEPRPLGEYAMSTLGRERIFEYYSGIDRTPVSLIRLNYACEMRYGVLVDIARRVWEDEPVSLTMGYLNALWQADANAMALASLAHAASPPFVLNLAGERTLRVRDVARRFGELMGKNIKFEGRESPDAFLSDASKSFALFGKPLVSEDLMIEWTADWVMRGGASLGKPTHFEARDGKY